MNEVPSKGAVLSRGQRPLTPTGDVWALCMAFVLIKYQSYNPVGFELARTNRYVINLQVRFFRIFFVYMSGFKGQNPYTY